MASIKENYEESQKWDPNLTGDEWTDQAEFCNQPYQEWKESLVKWFITPYIDKNSIVLEIGPGHGRFTEYLVKKASKVILVDISPNCLDVCRERFSRYSIVEYLLNDGKSLEAIKSNSVDFIWSYDSFVAMEKDVYEAYFKEFSRILKPKGVAVIHHPERDFFIEKLKTYGKLGRLIARAFSSYDISCGDGGRTMISMKLVRKIANRNNLKIAGQVDSWGENNQYNCKELSDVISIILKNQDKIC